ncbi:solute carrier family 12 member 6-like isoform X1 [Artemia franciscana]|uniref:solute carrier family 12 member 6-like isoform X1 n=1 Tax=Artemia franciscana TaxID=6661 RepID=UPI0032DBCDA2
MDGEECLELETGEVTDEAPFVNNKKETLSGYEKNLYLYHESGDRPIISSILQSFQNYSATTPAPSEVEAAQPSSKKAGLGWMSGVYFPCMQNIFGIILFIRFTWLVGTAGVIQAFFIVFGCCCVTMLTAISMSAIATNGVVPAGGPYYMISRNLGPELGGAIGLLFYVGTTFAAAMYIVGAVEILIQYMTPGIALFGDPLRDNDVLYNNLRIYGSVMVVIVGLINYLGVQTVSKAAPLVLFIVVLSITSVYVGIGVNYEGSDRLQMCVLGTRLLSAEGSGNCTKAEGSELWNIFCKHVRIVVNNRVEDSFECDPYFEQNEVKLVSGIKGIESGVFLDSLGSWYLEENQIIASSINSTEINRDGAPEYNQVLADLTTSFTVLVGIFFPSVTGIMAGCNRSGDLADPQKAIPLGTIAAILTTSFVYISCLFLFGATLDPLLMRDKFGQSIGGKLVVANMAWPNEWVILIGSFLATTGAGLQSLISAPRLLQAIAKDEIVPCLKMFGVQASNGEPRRALFMSLLICECGVLLGNVDILAPLLSMFFLMLYGTVNLACCLQTLLRSPNWRPRFKFYHWGCSLLGSVLCVAVMFMTSWLYAIIALGLAVVLYKYIKYTGAEKEWGDGMRGLALSLARFSLLHLEQGPPHCKNWRPQILLLSKLEEDFTPVHRKLFSFAHQLKAGKGLTICVSVLQGDFMNRFHDSEIAKKSLRAVMEEERVKGFFDVIVAKHQAEGVSFAIQNTGLGGLKPNTVIVCWPRHWRNREETETGDQPHSAFVTAIQTARANEMAVLVPKGLETFPDSTQKLNGFIDVWWIVHDGGLLMLLPFLLKKHRCWSKCKLRIFTVAQLEDNSIQMKKDLKDFLYQLRIDAVVEVVEMTDADISAYTVEKTLRMEQRNQLLQELHLSKKESMNVTTAFSSGYDLKIQSGLDLKHSSELRNSSRVRFTEDSSSGDPAVIMESDSRELSTGSDVMNNISRTPSVDQPILPPPEEIILKSSEASVHIPNNIGNHSESQPALETQTKFDTQPNLANVRRMHTAVQLNATIRSKSENAALVVINLPGAPRNTERDQTANYMEFLEVLTENISRVLMVNGSGQEVVTIYS